MYIFSIRRNTKVRKIPDGVSDFNSSQAVLILSFSSTPLNAWGTFQAINKITVAAKKTEKINGG
jgi:hypothetical protein